MPKASGSESDPIFFKSPAEFRKWLEKNHETAKELWIGFYRKSTGKPSLTWPETVDEVLCFGWIDGIRKSIDEESFKQRVTPRRPTSIWSKINIQKIATLTSEGRMKPAGLREVERAKADGRWQTAYEGQRTISVPTDLRRELDTRPAAAEFFASLDSRNRYAILYRLQDAKKPETRARRLEKFVAMLEAGETIHPPARRRS